MEDLTKIITAASPFIKPFIDTFFTPKIENLKNKFNLDINKNYTSLLKHFTKYFDKTYSRLSIINTLVFKNTKVKIKDIYIPLTLSNRHFEKQGIKVINYPKAFIESYQKILITDSAGMGKSTLLKWIFITAIDNKEAIPIFIELRRLSKEKKILEEIHEQINDLDKSFDKNLLHSLIAEGGFLFLFDGYDEISFSDRDFVTKDIQKFISDAPKNIYILTSRPEDALVSFGDFEKFQINPLTKTEAFQLLKKYDNNRKISELLIKKLKEPELNNIDEFLVNPLLVSLLFIAFEFKHKIPFKKHLFYRQVYDANFDSHDLSKGDSYTHDKYCKLDIDNFHRILRHIGFSCLRKKNILEFSKDEILTLIRNAKSFCSDLNFSESDFLKDLLSTVPLFNQDGIYYRWAHKSLQEYFAAQFIYLDSKDKQLIILNQIYNSPSLLAYLNILDLYSDIDPKTFKNLILYNLLNEFSEYFKNSFKELENLIKPNLINFRKEINFLNTIIAFKINDNGEKGTTNARILSGQIGINRNLKFSFDMSLDDDSVYFAIESAPKTYLLNIFGKKGFDFLEPINSEKDKLTKLKCPDLKKHLPYILDDKKDNLLNSEQLFKLVNKGVFYVYSSSFRYRINHEKAFILLNEIKQQINCENYDDYSIN